MAGAPADVPLLDEAAELLGADDRPGASAAVRRRLEEIAYAQGALDIAGGSRSIDLEDEDDPELLTPPTCSTPTELAERHGAARAVDRGRSGPPPTAAGRSGT